MGHHSQSDTSRCSCLGWVSEKKPKYSTTGMLSGKRVVPPFQLAKTSSSAMAEELRDALVSID